MPAFSRGRTAILLSSGVALRRSHLKEENSTGVHRKLPITDKVVRIPGNQPVNGQHAWFADSFNRSRVRFVETGGRGRVSCEKLTYRAMVSELSVRPRTKFACR